MNKQINSHSEYREYETPTAASTTTLADVRAYSQASGQSLLGAPPAGSDLAMESIHTMNYFSPLADVTRTVTNGISEPYQYDGGATFSPILYEYLEHVVVDISASVTKTGYVAAETTTTWSKSIFSESNIGEFFNYKALQRFFTEPTAENNYTSEPYFAEVTEYPGCSSSGNLRTITVEHPQDANLINVEGQGTSSTVNPDAAYHTGTDTLGNYRQIGKAIAEHAGALAISTVYVRLPNSQQDQDPNGSDGGQDGDGVPNEGQNETVEPDLLSWEAIQKNTPFATGFLKGFFIDGAYGDIQAVVDTARFFLNFNAVKFGAETGAAIGQWVMNTTPTDIARAVIDAQRLATELYGLWSKIVNGNLRDLTPEEQARYFLIESVGNEVAMLVQQEIGKINMNELGGRIVGMITYEIALTALLAAATGATVGAASPAAAAKIASLAAKLRKLGGTGKKIADAIEFGELGVKIRRLIDRFSSAPKGVASFADELTISGDLARARLRSALGLARGNADEAHHLIPVGLRDHDVVQRAARGGFNFNGVDNGVAMSFDRHRGVNIFHHNKYNDAIRSRLERELLSNPSMTDAQAADFLRAYTEQLRNAINNTRGRLR
ncbi:MAG: AHH domain-containing protein [Pirellulaceae bacterium]|nr:AHH domain-containing protein [Pirellulaceae bacterium]